MNSIQEAYIEGFRKTAEAYGIEPEELYKFAQLGKVVGMATKLLKSPVKRLIPATKSEILELGPEGLKHLFDMKDPRLQARMQQAIFGKAPVKEWTRDILA